MNDAQQRGSISDQALRWFVRLHSGEATAFDRQHYEAWLAQSFTHQQEYRRVASTWRHLDELKSTCLPELVEAKAYWETHSRAAARRIWRPLRISAMIAALLALVIAGGWWWTILRVEVTAYHTARGEQRTVKLADGSTIEMNTDTMLSVQLSGRFRKVVLEHGEALFAVAHEPRSFDVIAGAGTTRDIGTQFSVYKQPDQVVVAVIDGSVEVTVDSAPGKDRRVLTKGSRMSYTDGGLIFPVEALDPHTITAWRHGKLIFESMSLADAIQEVGRYWAGDIQLTDPALAELKITGIFNVKEIETFFQAIEQILPVKVTHVKGRHVLISKAQAA